MWFELKTTGDLKNVILEQPDLYTILILTKLIIEYNKIPIQMRFDLKIQGDPNARQPRAEVSGLSLKELDIAQAKPDLLLLQLIYIRG